MPGFVICGQGQGPAATLESRRRYRWMFQTLGGGIFDQTSLLVLQKAQRPNVKFQEPVMHHQQEQAYFAGKHEWEVCKLQWYDIEQDPDVSAKIYEWFETVIDFTTANVNPPSVYKKTATLSMTDGAGQPTESWLMCNAWPKEGNWNDLDYTATEICTLEVTMRYDRAYKTSVTT